MLYKSAPTEFKTDREQRIFEGYASVFDNVDLGGDRVRPGAFAKTLRERKDRVKVLWQHSPGDPIGLPVEMEEDSTGLMTRTRVSKTALGDDVLTLLEDGVVDQMSIGYSVVKDEWDEDSFTRDLVEVKLYEYSPVTFAMNELAFVTGVSKSASLEEVHDMIRKADLMAQFGLKAGRVLSKRNLALVKQAYTALGALIETAEASDDEPDKSTHPGDDEDSGAAKAGNAEEPGDPTPEADPDDPFEGLIEEIRSLGGYASERKLIHELRNFGRELRTGGD